MFFSYAEDQFVGVLPFGGLKGESNPLSSHYFQQLKRKRRGKSTSNGHPSPPPPLGGEITLSVPCQPVALHKQVLLAPAQPCTTP